MSDPRFEVLLSSEATGQMFNVCVWDPATGSNLRIYKGNATKSRTLTTVGNSFLVSGQPNKPLLNVWPLNKHEQKPLKFITPGVLQSLTASPCGHFLVGSVDERLYLWQTSSGKLLRIISNGHYQAVSVTKFLSDGSHFVSGGQDGNVILWPLDSSKPRHVWNQHSLGITDIHVGMGGLQARIASASKDQTVKVYEAASGQLLLSVEFDAPLFCVALDSAEELGFVGTSSGLIHMFSLMQPPRDLKMTLHPENTLRGHSQAVNCLSVSLDGLSLASGSSDTDVRIWHVKSRQCVKTIPHKGSLTSLQYMIPKRGMINFDDFLPDVTFSLLEKTVFMDKNSDLYSVDILENMDDAEEENSLSARQILTRKSCLSTNESSDKSEDNDEIKKLKIINQNLYQAAAKAILHR